MNTVPPFMTRQRRELTPRQATRRVVAGVAIFWIVVVACTFA